MKLMRFTFGNSYYTNMTAVELYGNGRYGSAGYNIPIKLPDGRFIRVSD